MLFFCWRFVPVPFALASPFNASEPGLAEALPSAEPLLTCRGALRRSRRSPALSTHRRIRSGALLIQSPPSASAREQNRGPHRTREQNRGPHRTMVCVSRMMCVAPAQAPECPRARHKNTRSIQCARPPRRTMVCARRMLRSQTVCGPRTELWFAHEERVCCSVRPPHRTMVCA